MDTKVGAAATSTRMAELLDAYSRRVYPAVLEQHGGPSVSSPLGVWLLLAACATGARGENRTALEDVLGCGAGEAGGLLKAFTASPPPALEAAIAVWVAAALADGPQLAEWVTGLPGSVESGLIPTQAQADAWAERNTLGLIKRFPLDFDDSLTIVLASALATKVSWQRPFDVVSADGHLGPASPWRGIVERLLWDSHPGQMAMIADTRAAGLVAVHEAVATEELTVISVSAEPGVARDAVLDAAHEVAASVCDGVPAPRRSLFELPLGDGHSWQLSEREARTFHAGQRVERIAGVSLPAWRVESDLKLQASPLFGTAPALDTLDELTGSGGGPTSATQAAVASFTRYGFEAAAVTSLARVASAIRAPLETGVQRTATLRFDHPYAAIAIAGKVDRVVPEGARPAARGQFTGLPLFAAWVHRPDEAEQA